MRKRRTRAHIIGDLGYNHTEKQVLLAGHVLTKVTSDYGFDGLVNTFDSNGEIEHRFFLVQVKATENIKFSSKNQGFELSLSKKDLSHWLKNPVVVLAVLFNFQEDKSYFIHVQEYFSEKNIELASIKKYIQVFIPRENEFTPEAVNFVRAFKNL